MHLLNKLKNYFGSTPSLFLLVLPYVINFYQYAMISAVYLFVYSNLILVLVFIIDVFYRKLYQKTYAQKSKLTILVHLVYAIFFIFFYSVFFITHIMKFFNEHHISFRLWLVVVILFLGFLLVLLTINKIYTYLNRVLMILCLIGLVNFSYVYYKKVNSTISTNKTIANLKKIHTAKWTVNVTHKSDKPIIFIILDEYASPVVFEKANVKKVPDMADYLNSTGWITKKQSYSAETNTLWSISSIFNNNLSKDNTYFATDILKASETLGNASVIKHLAAKNITFSNYSFFTIAGHQRYTYLYIFPHSYIDLFLVNTLYQMVKLKAQNLDRNNHGSSTYNQEIYQIFTSTLNKQGKQKQFIYLHLLMPHAPISFSKEINLQGYSASEYYQYWLFTNKKIISALKNAKHLNDYRIIISGDHGYRQDKRIDAHQTLTAFYGFAQADIEQIHSVQDLGTLIEGSFK